MDNTHAITSQSYACIVYIGPVSDWACKYFGSCSCQAFFLQAVVEDGASHRLTTFIVTASRTHEVSPNKGYANVKNAHTCAHVVFLLWHAMLAARLWTHRVIPIALALGMRIAKPLHRVCVLYECSPCTVRSLLQACDQAVIDESCLGKSETPGLPPHICESRQLDF